MNRREAVVLLGSIVLATSCGFGADQSTATSSTSPDLTIETRASTTTTSTTMSRAPATAATTSTPNTTLPDEPGAAPKAAAIAFVDALLNFERPDDPAFADLVSRTPNPGVLTAVVAPIRTAAASSTGSVVYAQLGGQLSDTSSVMVIARQNVGDGDAVERVLDVRVNLVERVWTVVGIASIGGAPPDGSPDLPPNVRSLLASERVDLPDSARWDLEAGRIDARVVDALLGLSITHRLSVTVLASGHPVEVFGRPTPSNHSSGRAVDIWAVADVPVVGQRTDTASPAHQIVAAAQALGATEIGSPWDLDGPGGATFANALHQDHLHIAFDR